MDVTFSKGGEIKFYSYRISESFNNYCTELELVTGDENAFGTITMEVKNNPPVNWYQVKSEVIGINLVKITYWLESYVMLTCKKYPMFKGNKTYEKLMEQYGITVDSPVKTNSSYWVLPEMRLSTLLETTCDKMLMQGGGPLMTYGIKEQLILVDCVSALQNLPKIEIQANQDSIRTDNNWMVGYPSKYKHIQQELTGDVIKEYNFLDDRGYALYENIVWNDLIKDQTERVLYNRFSRKLWTSLIVQYSDVHDADPYLGTVIVDKASSKESILYSIIHSGDGTNGETVLVGVSNATL